MSDFVAFWWFGRSVFGHCWGNSACPEAIGYEKGEYVFLSIVVGFRRIFTVHKGQKTVIFVKFWHHGTSAVKRITLVPDLVHFGYHMLVNFASQTGQKGCK